MLKKKKKRKSKLEMNSQRKHKLFNSLIQNERKSNQNPASKRNRKGIIDLRSGLHKLR